MAPLSHDLAGLILPHAHFGSHLNSQGETIDDELEKRNFAHAGKILAEVWSGTIIDECPVVAEYIEEPENAETDQLLEKNAVWHSRHVQESQYMLQIVKCNDRSCCNQFRSSLLSVLPERFIKAPIPIKPTPDGLKYDMSGKIPSLWLNQSISTLENPVMTERLRRKYTVIPYDIACPTITDKLDKRVCKYCHKYFASIKSVNNHLSTCDSRTGIPATRPTPDTRIQVRPQRLAARRQREMMCVLVHNNFEWHNEEDIDMTGLDEPESITGESGTPVMDTYRPMPWV
jgi:hypothetical protein